MPLDEYFRRFQDVIRHIDAAMMVEIKWLHIPAFEDYLLEALTLWPKDSAHAQLEILPRSKRLRGTLILVGTKYLDKLAPDTILLAAGIELIHSASLVLDDIQDAHAYRYGRPSLPARLGNEVAQNLALLLMARGIHAVARANPRLTYRLTETMGRMCRGQLDELSIGEQPSLSLADYERIVAGKTGALLTFPVAAWPRRLSKVSERLSETALQHFAIAHQIQDDLDDLDQVDGRVELSPSNIIRLLAVDGSPAATARASQQALSIAETHVNSAFRAIEAGGLPPALQEDMLVLVRCVGERRECSVGNRGN